MTSGAGVPRMDIRRLITAMALSMIVLIGFDYFMPKPQHPQQDQATTQTSVSEPASTTRSAADADTATNADDKRIPITGPSVSGSLNLRGARLDDLLLTRYHTTPKSDSPLVRVLDKATDPQPNFVQIGWRAIAGDATKLPDAGTLWEADGAALSPDHPLTLHWDNGQGQVFSIRLALDARYMFTVTQSVANHGTSSIRVLPALTVERNYVPEDVGSMLVHEGPVGVMNGRLEEQTYKAVHNNTNVSTGQAWAAQGNGGWAGITDKYWLTAIAPDHAAPVSASFGFAADRGPGSYRVGFVPQAPVEISAGAEAGSTAHVFAGAKELNLLEQYGNDLQITDFYKAVDFGWFGFATRPMFHLLHWLFLQFGNFGIALLAFTLIIKLVMFPLATKTVKSSTRMRQLAPRVQAIRDRNKDNPVAANQQVMALYREEGVNMFGGCLPALVQIPVFFCLYKVLNVAIDMRHAPFFGWIRDLSAPDPTNLFNLFGLVPFDPSVYWAPLHLGIWPILFGGTTFLMQRMNMATMDPAQQRIMQFMPIIYVFFMGRLPAGIVIYYTWNNLLTAGQQLLIQKRVERAGTPAKTVVAPVKKPQRKS